MTEPDPDLLDRLLPAPVDGLRVAPHLPAIEAQAAAADRTRSLDPEMVEGLRGSDVMRLSADPSLGGLAAPVLDIGRELEAVASADCASTGLVPCGTTSASSTSSPAPSDRTIAERSSANMVAGPATGSRSRPGPAPGSGPPWTAAPPP